MDKKLIESELGNIYKLISACLIEIFTKIIAKDPVVGTQ
jgi:hypothetical protein